MIENDFIVEPATWSTDQQDLRLVRTEVFVHEQQVPEDEEWDELDARSHHVIARDATGAPIGTGRLTPQHKIGRMAILREWRGKGVGAAILRVLIERARELHLREVELHAQTHAIPFYERAGFAAYGDEYDECGIPHRSMRLELPPLAGRPNSVGTAPTGSELLSSTNRAEAISAALHVISSARRELIFNTRDLDPDVLEHADVLEALKRLALSGPNTRIRMLVQDPSRATAECPRLLALAHRLSSAFAFRMPVEEVDRQYAGSYVASDRQAYFERALAIRFDGDGDRHAPARTAQLWTSFNAIWERSVPAVEMRRLDL
jgi:predicted GNAT family N-acyltransferase